MTAPLELDGAEAWRGPPARGPAPRAIAMALRSLGRVLRAVLGVPDYDRYVAHMQTQHPGARPLTRQEFVRDWQEARYSRPGSRCC